MAIPYTSPVSVDFRGSLLERAGPYYKYFLLAPLLITILAFFVGPLIWLFRVSLYVSRGAWGFGIGGANGEGGGYYIEGTWTLNNYIRIFTDGYFLSVLGFTMKLALIISIVAMLIAFPFAYYIYKSGPRLKAALPAAGPVPEADNMLVFGGAGLEILHQTTGYFSSQSPHCPSVWRNLFQLGYTLFWWWTGEDAADHSCTVLVMTATLRDVLSRRRWRKREQGNGGKPSSRPSGWLPLHAEPPRRFDGLAHYGRVGPGKLSCLQRCSAIQIRRRWRWKCRNRHSRT